MIKNWRRYFQSTILDRGRVYYLQKQVINLSYSNSVFSARVLGEASYNVEIKLRGEEIIYMKCSCPHAAKGNYCKHMAAVMYAIELEGEAVKAKALAPKDMLLNPFTIATEDYQYFDMGRITRGMEFSEKMYKEAKQLILKQKISLDRINVGFQRIWNNTEMYAFIYGRYQEDRYPLQLSMILKRNGIVQARCGAYRCAGFYEENSYYGSNEICKHLLALMILVDEYFKKFKPGDLTDPAGRSIVNGFRNLHFKDIIDKNVEEITDFVMEPILEKNGNHLNLGFKAGVEKLYVVKNLTQLMEKYEEKDTILFGTKTEVDFAKHRVSEKSKSVFDYIKRIVEQEQARNEHTRQEAGYYYEPKEIRNQINLYGEWLDAFYDIFKGERVICNDKSGMKTVKTEYVLKADKPRIQLDIKPTKDEEGVFHGISVKGNVPEFIKGNQYYYFFDQGKFCRIERDVQREIQPICDLAKDGTIAFSVGRKNLSEFYHQILPSLSKNVTVKEISAEEIKEYIPPEPVFAFYLDAENGNATCKPKARYGEQVVSLIDNYLDQYVYESFRNLNMEEEILYHLADYFKEIDVENDELHCGGSEDDILRLMDSGINRLMALGEVHTTERFRSINIRKRPKLQVGVSVKSDVMNLTVSSEDVSQEELLQLLQSYQRKKKYCRLKNGDFVAVNEPDMEMLTQMIENLKIPVKDFLKGNMNIPIYRALYLNRMLEQGENIYLDRDKYFKSLIKEFKTVEDSDFEIPKSLKKVIRKYQEHGFKWLKTLESYGFGGILADDMGLGKTLQMISVLLSAKENGRLGTAIIVCPASLVYNWKEEFSKFAPELVVTPVVGTQKERAEMIRNYQKQDVLVTSYDLLKRDVAEYEDVKFTYQILDEAQYIKNHTTAAAKSVKIIQSKYYYALTGTPIENRLSELWSIFDYLMPGFLYGYDTFRKQFETPIVKYKEENASEQLKKMVAPFILRRLKGDVLKDLPDKIEEVRYAKLEGKQQQLYDAQVVHMKEILAKQEAEDFQKNKLQILSELTKIRQICCDPSLLFEKYNDNSAKRLACMELIQSAIEGEHKILVFSQFTSMLELLEQDLKQQKIEYFKITGATPKEKRVEMVTDFNQGNVPVFLISLKAGGTGLNLVGADVVIHYDPWWNQAVQNQATDRAHRIGQTKAVSVYKLIAKGTIEEKIVKMQEDKRNLADSILSGDMGGIAQMSKEELIELLTV